MSDKTYKDPIDEEEEEDIVITFQRKIRSTKDVHVKFDAITESLFKFNVCGKSGDQGCPFFPEYNQLENLHDEFDYDLNGEEDEASNPEQAKAKYGNNKTLLEDWWRKYRTFMEKANYTWRILKQIKAQKNEHQKVIEQKHDWIMELFEGSKTETGSVSPDVVSFLGKEIRELSNDVFSDEEYERGRQAEEDAVNRLKKHKEEVESK